MANVKITELDFASTPLAGSELIEIVQGGVNKKVEVNEVGGGGGVTEFIELTDVPASYTGQGSKVVAVKVDETGLEFVAGGGGTTPTLQAVLDEGKTATFTGVGGEDISINMGDDVGGEGGIEMSINQLIGDVVYESQFFYSKNRTSIRNYKGNSSTNINKYSSLIINDGNIELNKTNEFPSSNASQTLEFEDLTEAETVGNPVIDYRIKKKTVSGTYYLVDEDYVANAIAGVTTPDATPTVKGIAKLYTSLGSNTDGAVDQNTVNTALQGFIPLSGTTVGNPVTGDIEFGSVSVPTVGIINNQGGTVQSVVLDNDIGFVNIYSTPDAFTNYGQILVDGGGISLINNGVSVVLNEQKGMFSVTDFSAEDPTNKLIYAQRQYVENGLALKANLQNVEQIIRSKANGTFGSHTGDTAETVIAVIDIDANEFEAGDWLTALADFTKNGTAGNLSVRFRAGVNGNTSDTLIALYTSAAGNGDIPFERQRFQFLTGDMLSGFRNITSSTTDNAGSSVAKTTASVTPTADWKFSITAQLGNSGDSVELKGYRIGKIKSF